MMKGFVLVQPDEGKALGGHPFSLQLSEGLVNREIRHYGSQGHMEEASVVLSRELVFKPSEPDFLIREVSVGDFLTSESL